MKSIAIDRESSAAIKARDALAKERAFFLLTLSRIVPIGTAKSNQGSMVSAPIKEISTGSLVRNTANKGKAVLPNPSERLEKRFAAHSFLNAGLLLIAQILGV